MIDATNVDGVALKRYTKLIMINSNHPLERKISVREKRCAEIDVLITDLRAEKEKLLVEIGAYKDALQYVQGSFATNRPEKPLRKRSISDQWVGYLKTASNDGTDSFTLDELVFAAELAGHEVKRPSLRTQAANFVTRGTLERIKDGVFMLTEAGCKELGLERPKRNEEAKASSDADEGATSSKENLFN